MKPFEVEIFDRNFNFRSNALIDPDDFQYQLDMLTVVDNTITLPKSSIIIRQNPSSGSAGDQTVGISDYIRIKTNLDTFSGMVKKLEKQDDSLIITYTDFMSLLNHDVFTNPLTVAYTPIERYIEDLLTKSFINNSDTSQRIPGLTITVRTTTMGSFDFMDTTKSKVIFNILNDLVYPAFKKYLVGCFFSLDVSNKQLNVNIGRKSTTILKTIEADLPNIIDKNVIIRGSSNEVNKLKIIEDSEENEYPSYDYYLHTDYSYDTNKNTNRMLPVINDMQLVNIDNLVQTAYWTENIGALYAADVIEVDREITQSEGNDLTLGMSLFASSVYSLRGTDYCVGPGTSYYSNLISTFVSWLLANKSPFSGHSYTWMDDSIENNIYEDLEQHGEGYYCYVLSLTAAHDRGYQVLGNKGAAGDAFTCNGSITDETGWHTSDPITARADRNCNYHVVIKQKATITLYITLYGNEGIPSVYKFDLTTWTGLTRTQYEEAHARYLELGDYQVALNYFKANHLSDILSDYAGTVFGTSKYKNLIELTTRADDSMIQPLNAGFGLHANIIHKGITYHSILTGGSMLKNGLFKLTFGMIRLELTKILNMKGV